MEYVFRALVAAQYVNGASVADVQAACQRITQLTGNTWSVASEADGVLVLRETSTANGQTALWPVQSGQVVVVDPAVGIVDRLAADLFAARYIRVDQVAGAVADGVLTRGLASQSFMSANATDVLTRGLNSAPWIAALRTKLGLPPASGQA